MKIQPILLPALIVAALLTACGKKAPQPVAPPALVHVQSPLARETVEWDEYTGRLEAVDSVELRARVSGYLNRIAFKEGSLVQKGDLLFEIDPRPYQAAFDLATAEHERALAQAELAKNDFERAQRLITTKVISDEDFDTKAKFYVSAQAGARSAKAAADSAKLNLDFTRIHAPISGRIGRALVTQGNLVAGGAAGSTVLTTLVSLDPLYCYADADERSILKYIKLSQEGKRESARDVQIPVEMALAGDHGFPHKGVVDFLDNRVDPNTGTMRARGVFPNPDQTLSPGFFARVRVAGSGKYHALLIPDRAISSDQATKYVFVVNTGNQVEVRPVRLGPIVDDLRVITEGLKVEDRVIVDGLLRVRPGVVVNPQPAKSL